MSINIFFYFIFAGDMVYKRFQNMESTFRANERKIRESKARCSGKGTDEMYKPKWEYYEMLLFLKRTCTQSDSVDNLSTVQSTSLISEKLNSPVRNLSSEEDNSRISNIYYDENTKVNIKLTSYYVFLFSIIFYIFYFSINIFMFNIKMQ